MEHHVRAIGNPIGVGVFAVLAGLGVAHLGRFRASAFARTSRGFWERSSALHASQLYSVALSAFGGKADMG
jgi:hypothetical protein